MIEMVENDETGDNRSDMIETSVLKGADLTRYSTCCHPAKKLLTNSSLNHCNVISAVIYILSICV